MPSVTVPSVVSAHWSESDNRAIVDGPARGHPAGGPGRRPDSVTGVQFRFTAAVGRGRGGRRDLLADRRPRRAESESGLRLPVRP